MQGFCPFSMGSVGGYQDCYEDQCNWWDRANKQCLLVTIGLRVQSIQEQVDRLAGDKDG